VIAASPAAPDAAALDDDELIQYSRDQSSRHLARWDWTGFLAALFAIVAVGAIFLPAHRELSLEALGVSVVCYALASRVQFEFGGGYAIPTEGVLVAMWFLLPPRMLPLVVCCSMLLGALPDLIRRRMPLDRLALSIVGSWHAVGPAAVLFLAGSRPPAWRDAPIYLGALAAQLVCDFAAAFFVTRPVIGIRLLDQLKAVAPAYAVDVLLAPLGVLGEVGQIVRSCHERWDGAGYPDGLAGEAIPLAARIVCACDAWSAMTTDRSYRKARTRTEAAAELRASAGTHFDPRVVDALVVVLGL
jgi:HD domain